MTNTEAFARIKQIGGISTTQLAMLRISAASKKYMVGVLERASGDFAYIASMERGDFSPSSLRSLSKAGFIVRTRRGRKVAFLRLRRSSRKKGSGRVGQAGRAVSKNKTSMPSRVVGKIEYVNLTPVAKAYKTTPAAVHTLVEKAVSRAVSKWRWKPIGLIVSFHSARKKSGGRSMGISWPRNRPHTTRLVSLHVDNFATSKKSFEGVILHELAHHFTEETRTGKRPKNAHDAQFCVNFRKVHELIKNQRICQFYFKHEEFEHLRGKPGEYTRMGPSPKSARRNPSLQLPPPPPGGIEELALPEPPKGGIE